MGRIAQVLVNIPTRQINKCFSYSVPDAFSFVSPGWRVWVSFGGRETEGFVTALEEGDEENLKEIAAVWDDEPWFDDNMLATARWISNYYLCSFSEALRLFVPGGATRISSIAYTACPPGANGEHDAARDLKREHAEVFSYIQAAGPVGRDKLVKRYGAGVVRSVQFLLRRKLIKKQVNATSRAKPRFEHIYRLTAVGEEAAGKPDMLKGKPAQRRLLELLSAVRELTGKQVKERKFNRTALVRLVEAGFISAERVRLLRDSYADAAVAVKRVKLTTQQEAALAAVRQAITSREFKSFLLHGTTGSGKTEVYMEAAAAARQANRQVIVLVPEIALTGQVVNRFKARFGDDVTVIHSKLSLAERYDAWERLRSGSAGIAIGARSAVFSPLAAIGLIILDEEHEFTYKQEETPRYHARDVALIRAKLAGAPVILGSATPMIETFHQALAGEHTLLSMPTRVSGKLPNVTVVDMREELKRGNRSVISGVLAETLSGALARGEQAIVLLNRRGYATFVLCRECGHVLTCGHCSVALVYHTSSGAVLRCHYCQRSKPVPDVCPECRSRYIRYFGSGTQKVEEELKRIWPDVRILRMDQDTTGRKMAHEHILADFAAGKYDILLGTQMVAKGHDIPNVTAVGIISADTALNLPDFRAAEKTFSLLTQAAGRAGRGERPGHVVVQTYNPEHYAVVAGVAQDYAMFYQAEMGFRRSLGYPPFSKIIKITFVGAEEAVVFRQANNIAAQLNTRLRQSDSSAEVLGPFAAAVSRLDDVFRINIMLKVNNLPAAQAVLTEMNLSAQPGIIIDVEPLNTM